MRKPFPTLGVVSLSGAGREVACKWRLWAVEWQHKAVEWQCLSQGPGVKLGMENVQQKTEAADRRVLVEHAAGRLEDAASRECFCGVVLSSQNGVKREGGWCWLCSVPAD